MAILSFIKGFFIYKEPKNKERFELLENDSEGNTQYDSGKNTENDTDSTKRPKRAPRKRRIIKICKRNQEKIETTDESSSSRANSFTVGSRLETNLEKIKSELNYPTNQDVIIRDFMIMQQIKAFIVYIDGMADKTTINDYILRQLMKKHANSLDKNLNTAEYISNNFLAINQVTRENDFPKIIKQILNGLTALFVDGCDECILIESRGYEKRKTSPPKTETVIKGSQEAFVEDLRTNLTLLRKLIRNKDLITEILPAGKTDNLSCAIMYLKNITNPELIKEVKKRISSIDIDAIPGNGVLDQLIEDHPFALVPQILSTERPDRTVYHLMDGKIAIICDGTPFASIAPVTFFDMLHTSEDMSLRWHYGTFLRLIRIFAVFLAIFLPAFYVALVLYHQEMIPNELLISIVKAREAVPFPTIVELIIMEMSFELMREASLRIPGIIGQTIGIIGAVILGQAAVMAGLICPILIIIVSITGLGSFAIPDFSLSFGIRILRFIFILLGTVAGFYGIASGIAILGSFACSMKSFGVPYFSPVSPRTKVSSDVTIKTPIWMHRFRSDYSNSPNKTRAGNVVRGWARQNGENE